MIGILMLVANDSGAAYRGKSNNAVAEHVTRSFCPNSLHIRQPPSEAMKLSINKEKKLRLARV